MIILIGNYRKDHQQSMTRFALLLDKGIIRKGHTCHLILPSIIMGQLFSSTTQGIAKWFGYLDKYLIFPFVLCVKLLMFKMRSHTDKVVVHICDHSNAIYAPISRLFYKTTISCHDMLAIRSALGDFPENTIQFTGKVLQQWISWSLKSAHLTICVSKQTQQDLQELHPTIQSKTISNSLNYPYRKQNAAKALQCIIDHLGFDPSPYIIHVGGRQWYKNRQGVYSIYAKLCNIISTHYRLIIIGPTMDPSFEFPKEITPIYLSNLKPHELEAFYSKASLLLFPSLVEGFGWPIIEAQACGCLVATSNRSPMNEIGGDSILYIDPNNSKASAEAIKKLFNETQGSRLDRIHRGYENVEKYSESRMMDQYLETLQQV